MFGDGLDDLEPPVVSWPAGCRVKDELLEREEDEEQELLYLGGWPSLVDKIEEEINAGLNDQYLNYLDIGQKDSMEHQ